MPRGAHRPCHRHAAKKGLAHHITIESKNSAPLFAFAVGEARAPRSVLCGFCRVKLFTLGTFPPKPTATPEEGAPQVR